MTKLNYIILVAAFSAAAAFGQAADDKKAALKVVDQLFFEMASANPAGILALHVGSGDLAAVQRMPDGKSRYSSLNGEKFSQLFTKKSPVMKEEMYAPNVETHGDWAMVWGRYVFWVDEKISHCGINQFNLVRVDGTWKIANGASTIDRGDCSEKEKAMKPDPAKWTNLKN